MTIFYRVSYSDNGRVRFEDFDFFNDALDFVNKIRKSGERARMYQLPRVEW